jgi:hypothetical protein
MNDPDINKKEPTEVEEHIPECVEVKLAYDLAAIPVLGYFFYAICYVICCIKLGVDNASNSFWLRKGAKRLWPPGCILLLILLFIVIALIAILPVIIGDDLDARYAASMQNLQTMRSAVAYYYARTGTYPSENLRELYTVPFDFEGKRRTMIRDIPPELISSDDVRPAEQNPPNRKVYNKLGTEGGWFYDPKSGRVSINYNKELDKYWGRPAGQNPSRWE